MADSVSTPEIVHFRTADDPRDDINCPDRIRTLDLSFSGELVSEPISRRSLNTLLMELYPPRDPKWWRFDFQPDTRANLIEVKNIRTEDPASYRERPRAQWADTACFVRHDLEWIRLAVDDEGCIWGFKPIDPDDPSKGPKHIRVHCDGPMPGGWVREVATDQES